MKNWFNFRVISI